MRTDEERRAYSRGYNTGSRGAWPEHRPPNPPEGIAREIIQAALALRDGVDGEIATFLDDEPVIQRIGPLIDAFDVAMAQMGQWVRAVEEPCGAPTSYGWLCEKPPLEGKGRCRDHEQGAP